MPKLRTQLPVLLRACQMPTAVQGPFSHACKVPAASLRCERERWVPDLEVQPRAEGSLPATTPLAANPVPQQGILLPRGNCSPWASQSPVSLTAVAWPRTWSCLLLVNERGGHSGLRHPPSSGLPWAARQQRLRLLKSLLHAKGREARQLLALPSRLQLPTPVQSLLHCT